MNSKCSFRLLGRGQRLYLSLNILLSQAAVAALMFLVAEVAVAFVQALSLVQPAVLILLLLALAARGVQHPVALLLTARRVQTLYFLQSHPLGAGEAVRRRRVQQEVQAAGVATGLRGHMLEGLVTHRALRLLKVLLAARGRALTLVAVAVAVLRDQVQTALLLVVVTAVRGQPPLLLVRL